MPPDFKHFLESGGFCYECSVSLTLLLSVFEPFDHIVNILLVEHFIKRFHKFTEITMVHEGRFYDAVLFDDVVHAVVLIAEIATAGKRAETDDIGTSLPPTRNHVFINANQKAFHW